jgi:hypothetical protein
MELLDDVGDVESHLFLFGDSVTVVQDRCTVCTKYTICSKNVLDAPDDTPRSWGSGESYVRFGIVLILTQDRFTVCVEHTIGSEIVWTHPMELIGDVGHVESRFFPFKDMVHGLL